MATFHADPFAPFDSLAREFFNSPGAPSRTPRFMPMDLYKVEDTYTLSADLPGVDPESIDVDIANGVLTISAERRTTPTDENAKWVTNERRTGSYRRQLTLSDAVDTEQVSAEYDNGVLTLTLPLAERARNRKIRVSRAAKEIDAPAADGSDTAGSEDSTAGTATAPAA